MAAAMSVLPAALRAVPKAAPRAAPRAVLKAAPKAALRMETTATKVRGKSSPSPATKKRVNCLILAKKRMRARRTRIPSSSML